MLTDEVIIADEIACPTCFRVGKPKTDRVNDYKNHEFYPNDWIEVTETCRFCRNTIMSRVSTDKIEKVRNDIKRLNKKINQGDASYLKDVLEKRVQTYQESIREFNAQSIS